MDPDFPLLQSMARGDEAALRELMARHKEALHGFTYRYAGNAADAAELTQETFVRAWFKAASFKPRASVKSWLYSIAANQCRDLARRNRKRSRDLSLDRPVSMDTGETEADRLSSTAPDAARHAQADEELQRLRLSIERLPHKLKTPFILCVLEEHSQQEAAAILKTSVKSVETRIYRARKVLRELLNHD